MSAEYEGMGIRFQYPENWQLDVEEDQEGPSAVTVYSPGGAFWSVALHPRSADPDTLAQIAVAAIQGEYEDVEVTPASITLAGHALAGYDMNFIYLDLTNTAQVLSARLQDHTVTVFCQGEDREFESAGAVFNAMTSSLIFNMPKLSR